MLRCSPARYNVRLLAAPPPPLPSSGNDDNLVIGAAFPALHLDTSGLKVQRMLGDKAPATFSTRVPDPTRPHFFGQPS